MIKLFCKPLGINRGAAEATRKLTGVWPGAAGEPSGREA